MAEANGLLAGGQQFLQHVIDGEIARRRDENALAALHSLANEFRDRGGFAGSGRAMNDGHVGAVETETHRPPLRFVQPGWLMRRGDRGLRSRSEWAAEQDVAQLGEAVLVGGAAL